MIKSIEELKNKRPDLVELFENMDKSTLLNQCYLECIDAINMDERVQTFMNEVTDLSYTTYTPEVIKSLVHKKEENDISNFCKTMLEDIEGMHLDKIKKYLKDEIKE